MNTVEDLTPINSHNITSPYSTIPPIIIHFNLTVCSELTDNPEYYCPSCTTNKGRFIEDPHRAETYCPTCGTIISQSYPWVGGQKVQNPFSYNYYIQQNFETNPIENWGGYSRKSY